MGGHFGPKFAGWGHTNIFEDRGRAKGGERLDIPDSLKAKGGPFTDEKEVDAYPNDDDIDYREKVKRMKLELQFA